MCGISGAIIKERSEKYKKLLTVSEIRGQDGTGVTLLPGTDITSFITWKSNKKASEEKLLRVKLYSKDAIIGQNRLACFGLSEENNQPLTTDRFALVHNGNLVNADKLFETFNLKRKLKVDTEFILRFIEEMNPQTTEELEKTIKDLIVHKKIKGDMACLLIDKKLKVLVAFKRYKPLFLYEDTTGIYFFSTQKIGEEVFGKQKFEEISNNNYKFYSLT